MRKESTIQDVLDVLQAHATHVDQQFAEVKSDITEIRGEIAGINDEITGMKGEISEIKNSMVTKEYFNESISDLRGDFSGEIYRQIRKHEVRYHGA